MKRIAIFENEYESVRGAFEVCNLLFYDNQLIFDIYPSSQKFNFDETINYNVIFMDIDLSSKSILDGYGVIEKLISIDFNISKKIVIITGDDNIKEKLISKGIRIDNILKKDVNFKDIHLAINKSIS